MRPRRQIGEIKKKKMVVLIETGLTHSKTEKKTKFCCCRPILLRDYTKWRPEARRLKRENLVNL